MASPVSSESVIMVPVEPLDLTVIWDNGQIRVEGVDEDAEFGFAALAGTSSPQGRFLIGLRHAEQEGLLPDPVRLTEAIEAFCDVVTYRFVWPREWGPATDSTEGQQAAIDALHAQIRRAPVATKLMLARSTREDIREGLLTDRA